MKRRIGTLGLLLAGTVGMLIPVAASAHDADGYYRGYPYPDRQCRVSNDGYRDHERREAREWRERRELRERQWREHERFEHRDRYDGYYR